MALGECFKLQDIYLVKDDKLTNMPAYHLYEIGWSDSKYLNPFDIDWNDIDHVANIELIGEYIDILTDQQTMFLISDFHEAYQYFSYFLESLTNLYFFITLFKQELI